MAKKPNTPRAAGVNAAHADNRNTESNQDNHPDQAILDAWHSFTAVSREIEHFPNTGLVTEHTVAQRMSYARLDAAENAIQGAAATTLAGVMIQLWLSLALACDPEDRDAVYRRDFDALSAKEQDLDWEVRTTFAAIRSLQQMEG